MDATRVNNLNLVLIAASLAAALVAPFELFLLAYAILGPLHYLTEISWLHDREYFTPGRRDGILLWGFGLAGTIFLPGIFGPDPLLLRIPWLGEVLFDWRHDIPFLALGIALILILTQKPLVRLAWALPLVVVLRFYHADPWFIRAFAIYLPSLVHVFVFTGLFMLLGALKGRERSGYVTIVAFLAAGTTACLAPELGLLSISEWARQSFMPTFESLARVSLFDFGNVDGPEALRIDIFEDPRAIAAMRFIGFAYTYHFLNWFSKTSIIGWNDIPASRYIAILAIWLISVGLYFFNYAIGLSWLFFLSFAHVVLEFPLNFQSIQGIASELRTRLTSRALA